MVTDSNATFCTAITMTRSWIRQIDNRLGLIGKMTVALCVGSLLMAAVATIAWLSFDRVVVLQRQIIDDTVPTMNAVSAINQLTPSTLALFHQLKLSRTDSEVTTLEMQGLEQLTQLEELLSQLQRQSFEPHLVHDIQSTLAEIRSNLLEQVQVVRASLQMQARLRQGLSTRQEAVAELMLLAEALAANASTYTSATVSSLYPLLDQRNSRDRLLASLDWLIEVDIDRMERMSELQLVCFRLKSLLDRVDSAPSAALARSLADGFTVDLAVLRRRIEDFRDPTRKTRAQRLEQTLATALGPDGLFALQEQRVGLQQKQESLQALGADLAIQFNDQGNSMLQANRHRVEQVGTGSRQAIGRGALGFLAVGALLVLTLFGTFWLLVRYELLGRLKSLELAMRALTAGRYDIAIDHSARRRDPLAPLVQALEQFRSHAMERERLEHSLREHQQQLESQVIERTAELRHSNVLLEREVQLHAQARHEAEEAHRAKNEFLGSLSHELRTPLSGVQGSVHLLRDTPLNPRQQEYVRMIEYANSTLLETMEDMLGFSRLEAGKAEVLNEAFSLRDTVDDMLALQTVTAQAKGLALVRDIAEDVPQWVEGDRRKLNQILLNTIGNAIKFTDEGEITVRVEISSATPTGQGQVGLVFLVSDTGIGIPLAQQDAVFKPFYQVQNPAHQRQSGTGLGLAICQRLVALMSGHLSLESVEGKGTIVRFELPFTPAPVQAPANPGAEASGTAALAATPPHHQALTVLIVEDDSIHSIVCQRYLESLGYRPHAVPHGAAALQWLQQSGAPDCVLMDMSLPGESGMDVTALIRQMDGGCYASLPIIGMSAHANEATLSHPAAATLAGFLTKPFQRRDLGEALAMALQHTPSGSATPTPRPATQKTPAKIPPPERQAFLDEDYLRNELQDLGHGSLQHLAQLFRTELRTTLEALHEAVARNDAPAAAKVAHRLRSAAGNLGLAGVVSACRHVEECAGGDGTASGEWPALVHQLEEDVAQALTALENWLQTAPGE